MRQRSPGGHTDLSLAWLLHPLTVDDFLGEIWGTTHYHVSRDRRDYLDSLRAEADSVDDLLALFRPHLSLVSLVRETERKDQYVYRLADGGFDARGHRPGLRRRLHHRAGERSAICARDRLDGTFHRRRAEFRDPGERLSHAAELARLRRALRRPRRADRATSGIQDLASVRRRSMWRRTRCGATGSISRRRPPRHPPTCAWHPVTSFMSHAAECMPPSRRRSCRCI